MFTKPLSNEELSELFELGLDVDHCEVPAADEGEADEGEAECEGEECEPPAEGEAEPAPVVNAAPPPGGGGPGGGGSSKPKPKVEEPEEEVSIFSCLNTTAKLSFQDFDPKKQEQKEAATELSQYTTEDGRVVNGYETDSGYEYRPSKSVKRSELMKMGLSLFKCSQLNIFLAGPMPSAPSSFCTDANPTKWHYEILRFGYKEKAIEGYDTGECKPNDPISRAEAAKVIVSMMGIDADKYSNKSTSLSDIEKGKWYYKYVVAAEENNLITGYKDGTFRPKKEITRGQAALILNRAVEQVEQGSIFISKEAKPLLLQRIVATLATGITPYHTPASF